MTKLDLSGRKDAAKKTLADAQVFRTTAGLAHRAADKADKAMPFADQASSEASAASGIYNRVDAAQDKVIAAGLDPADVFGDLLTDADRLRQSASDRLISAGEASDGT